ncbi:DUF2460 domain-containing protein [Marinibacterium profundimaris]|uniref:Glycoside hydrolase family 24 n=1 Tax=Marinibacterium profundimaris TaxID=1679460 RepID=A0A225NRE8_9RHOB|nr:DUF2460 domain-containing protein [Marinibacterium profundimaris]OWU77511.1 glycoside hydrolase family 24 [Marinibacterium profundimaris]
MNFHEIRFPASLSFGAIGGPERRTDIVTLANGFEERNTPWAHSRRRYDAGLGMRSLDDIERVIAFFEARQGQMYGFRWKDWTDFKSCAASAVPGFGDQVIGTGDGAGDTFQLVKTYASGGSSYARPVKKPVAGTVRIGVDGAELTEGSDFTVDATRGEVLLAQAPAAGAEVTAGFEFDVPVRFETDLVQVSVATFQAGEAPNVPVVEVRV